MTEDEKLKIETACVRLQTRYGTLADRQDPKFAELFIKDASITLPEYPPFAGLDNIMAGQAQWKASGVVMRHVVTNCTIEVQSTTHATGVCYLMVLARDTPLPPKGEPLAVPRVTFGEFHDHFVKVGGAWLIQSRTLYRMFRGFEAAA